MLFAVLLFSHFATGSSLPQPTTERQRRPVGYTDHEGDLPTRTGAGRKWLSPAGQTWELVASVWQYYDHGSWRVGSGRLRLTVMAGAGGSQSTCKRNPETPSCQVGRGSKDLLPARCCPCSRGLAWRGKGKGQTVEVRVPETGALAEGAREMPLAVLPGL